MVIKYLSEKEQQDILDRVIDRFLIPKFRELGMSATGNWEEKVEARGNTIWGQEYTIWLVNGRKPGKFAPIQPLITWVEAKLGLYGQEAVSVAYAINHKIQREGTEYYKRGGTDLLEVLYSEEVIRFISEEAQQIYITQVQLDIQRTLKASFK